MILKLQAKGALTTSHIVPSFPCAQAYSTQYRRDSRRQALHLRYLSYLYPYIWPLEVQTYAEMDITMPTFVESIHQPLPFFKRNSVVDYLVTALSLIVVYLVRTRYRNGLHKIPGPFLASFTSLWKWDVVRREKMPFVNTKLHEKHGPLVRIGPNHISASSAESIQIVHRSKSGFTKVLALHSSLSLY